MTYESFEAALKLTGKKTPFETLLMAAMRSATTSDQAKLQKAFPEVFDELVQRQNSRDGHLPGDP